MGLYKYKPNAIYDYNKGHDIHHVFMFQTTCSSMYSQIKTFFQETSSKLFNDKDTECGLLFLQKSTLLFEQQLSETNIFVDIEEMVEADKYYDTNSTIEMLAFDFPERQEFKGIYLIYV